MVTIQIECNRGICYNNRELYDGMIEARTSETETCPYDGTNSIVKS